MTVVHGHSVGSYRNANAVPPAGRAHGRAWIYAWAHLAAHVAEEAATGFLDVWNPVLAGLRQRTGVPFPHLIFGEWLTILIATLVILAALTPFIYRGATWSKPVSTMLAAILIVNGAHHLLSPLYLGRFLPGQYTSPLLIFAGTWLIVQTRRPASSEAAVGIGLAPLVGTVAFFLAAPVTVVGWIPYALTGWRLAPPFFGVAPIRLAGIGMIAIGAVVLVECFARFALVGRGTPAPVAPTRALVISGLYRHTRNPMYVGVLTALLGEALFLGSLELAAYAAVVWLAAHLFVVWYEEPALHAQYGPSFDAYRTHVPRWVPRIRPWRSSEARGYRRD